MEGKASFSIDTIFPDCCVSFNPYFDSVLLEQSISMSSGGASFDVSIDSSLIELDLQLPPSRKQFYRVSNDFSIDFQSSLLPIFVQQLSKADRPLDHDRNYDDQIQQGLRSTSSLELPSDDIPCSSLRKRYGIISKRILRKYLGFFRPLCRKLRCRSRGSGSKVASISSTQANLPSSPATLPVHSVVGVSITNKKKVIGFGSFDSEFCIHDAVLHCKRTNGMTCHTV